MQIIDSHIHIFDIYTGHPVKNPRGKIPLGLLSVLEWLEFRRPGGSKSESGRWLGNLVFAECCKRMQVCQPETYLKYFKQNHISQAIIMPVAPNVSTEQILNICENHDSFIPFASVDFNAANYIQKLHQYMTDGCKGLKIHPILQSIHPRSEKIYNLLTEFQNYKRPVCLHVGPGRTGALKVEAETYATPFNIEPLMRDFPDINFILAHMGLQFYDEVISMARTYDNIYLDTSFQPSYVLKKAESRIGSERIVFGTDFPLLNQKAVLKAVKKAFQANQTKLERICFANISKLIHGES